MKWVKMSRDAVIPTRATKFSAGYDIYANESVRIEPGAGAIVKTGITFEGLASDEFIQLTLRSGVSIKRSFLLANGVGIIDSDYAGNEIGVILYNRSNMPATVDKGEKIAQCILLNYNVVENEKKPTKERNGGYGSTDK